MRVVVAGFGVQGKKRKAFAGQELGDAGGHLAIATS